MKTFLIATFVALASVSTAVASTMYIGSLDAAERSWQVLVWGGPANPSGLSCEGSLEAAENCRPFEGSLEAAERSVTGF